MRSAVIYASHSGNTQRIAERIAGSLSTRTEVEILEVRRAPRDLSAFDLVIVGGPTEAHGMVPEMMRVPRPSRAGQRGGQAGRSFRHPSGLAALPVRLRREGIALRLQALGGRLVLSPESFIVSHKPELQPGEEDRAGTWGYDVLELALERMPVLARTKGG